MKPLTTTLTLLVSGLLAPLQRGGANPPEPGKPQVDEGTNPVSLRPLNLPGENLFAAHRSHSSHGSHRSHRSGSGGGYVSPLPAPAAPSPPRSAQPTDPGRPAAVPPSPAAPRISPLSRAEKQRLQIMRTQISLTTLGLYRGPINGQLDADTKASLKRFQTQKGLQANGLMTTETLNALGVQAIQ
jgi:His-Xaa-Ser repeat protein HxsA